VSTSAKDYVINKEELLKVSPNQTHKNRVKIFIDLSVPRNIDPEINILENINLYSIDDINNLIHSNLTKRSMEMDKAEKIISDLTQEYYDWYAKQFILPTMMDIKSQFDVVKQRTICTYKAAFNSLDKKHQDIISEMLDSYSDKLIKTIMMNIRKSASPEDLIRITKTLKNTFTIDLEEGEGHSHGMAGGNPHSMNGRKHPAGEMNKALFHKE
jgi:glutamyl-tRNA reductase